MYVNQELIDQTVVGLVEFISTISHDYFNMHIIKDLLEEYTADKLMYAVNLRRSLQNYDYSSGFFTDDEILHLIEESTVIADELPNNSIYGSR